MGIFRISPALREKIHHYANFRPTSVSLQQMVLFGQNPSQGTLLQASRFLSEELPVRLAHRAKELEELPHGLNEMPSIQKVKNWYANSFEELSTFPPYEPPPELREILNASPGARQTAKMLPASIPNLAMDKLVGPQRGPSMNGNGNANANFNSGQCDKGKIASIDRRYYLNAPVDVQYPPSVLEYNSRFTKLLENIKRRHDPTVTTVAQGVLEWKRSRNVTNIGLDVQNWLDRFYMSRIGIRFLMGQHIALNTLISHKDYVGIICIRSNVHDIAQEAIENARFVCEEHYAMFRGPPVQLICPENLTIPYVPGHLSHILFELLKNSLRAVVERYGADAPNLPPIKVVIVEGKEDITIKISDEGGGIPRSAIPLIWTYMYTTMQGQDLDQDFQSSDFRAPMAGFGYGLPLSRQYARYFGGDLRLISMEGYGTDVYIHLNRLSSSREALP